MNSIKIDLASVATVIVQLLLFNYTVLQTNYIKKGHVWDLLYTIFSEIYYLIYTVYNICYTVQKYFAVQQFTSLLRQCSKYYNKRYVMHYTSLCKPCVNLSLFTVFKLRFQNV